MFPDCVSSVDIVSDAENIKNLLKIPYSKKSVITYYFIIQTILFIYIYI